METINKIVLQKLEERQLMPITGYALLPQLMFTVFNLETPDDLEIGMYDRNLMYQEVDLLQRYNDRAIMIMLGLEDQVDRKRLAIALREAKTDEELREILIADLLYNRMCELLDDFPSQTRISPAEPRRGSAFL